MGKDLGAILFVGTLLVLPLGGVAGCNRAFNNKTIETPAYELHSYGTGINGHVEYTKYSDGSQDIKVYPGWGHRMFDSDLFQDLDGDGKVDKIRRNGAEWKMNSIREILVREQDYKANKKRFDNADERLQDLMVTYHPK